VPSERQKLRTSRRLARVKAQRRRSIVFVIAAAPAVVMSCLVLFRSKAEADTEKADLPLPKPYDPVVVRTKPDETRHLMECIEKLRDFQRRLPAPGPHDWLANHPEPGQTFKEYLYCDPVTARGTRRIIYVQPLGEFDEAEKKILRLTADFMSRYFNLSVVIRTTLPLKNVPPWAKRYRSGLNTTQIRTTWVLTHVLKPRLPDDAAVYIAFTSADLWPGEGWNFVFGQASLNERVGVWSLWRQGDPSESEKEFRRVLFRTLKIATHETGHMFSMQHCTAYLCNMCGCNSREEADRNPLHVCCECMAKICHATGADPLARYKRLKEFCDENGLATQGQIYGIFAAALEMDAPAAVSSVE